MENRLEYMRKFQATKYISRRQKALDMLGGVCVKCGITENLQFDHIDPTSKLFEIGQVINNTKWEIVEAELKKCQILCKKCHIKKSALDTGKIIYKHGTYGMYTNHGCRCNLCKEARNKYAKELYNRKKNSS